MRAASGGNGAALHNFGEQPGRRFRSQRVTVIIIFADKHPFSPIGAVSPRLLVHVDMIAEGREVAVDGIPLMRPIGHFALWQLGSARCAGQRIDYIMRRVVGGIDNHIAHGPAQLCGVLELAVFHPAVRRHKIEQLDHAGRIHGRVAAITGLNRDPRVAQIN